MVQQGGWLRRLWRVPQGSQGCRDEAVNKMAHEAVYEVMHEEVYEVVQHGAQLWNSVWNIFRGGYGLRGGA
jgi:hypothetical protein